MITCIKLMLVVVIMGHVEKGFGQTLSTDYFKSNVVTGGWSTAGSWQSSSNNTTWIIATIPPTNAANTITIGVGHTITTANPISLKQTYIDGVLEVQTGGILNIADGSGDDITIKSGGILRFNTTDNYAMSIKYTASAKMHILTGGKITIGNGSGAVGANYETITIDNIWDDGAIYDWNNGGSFATNGVDYFPVGGTTKPIFSVTSYGGALSEALATNINGIFEINTNVTFGGSSSKNFRDGIRGNGTLTQSTHVGNDFNLTGANAILDGASLKIILNSTLKLKKSTIVPLGASVIISGKNIDNNILNNSLTINGILDITDIGITNPSSSVVVNGIIRTAFTNAGGVYGTNGAIPSGVFTLNTNSTVEYYGGNQNITGTATLNQPYYNIIFSGSGIKTLNNSIDVSTTGSVKITGTTTVNGTSKNIGPITTINTTGFVMDGGRLIIGTGGTQPLMDGSYNITGGIIEYAGGVAKTIRHKTYQNIEISGNNVSNSSGNITLNGSGTFTVKNGGIFTINDNGITGPISTQTVTVENGGIFRTGNNEGFNGFAATFTNNSAIHSNIENIVLQTGATVEYSRMGNQPITNSSGIAYQNLTLSGTGIKTAPTSNLTLLGDFYRSGAHAFNANTGRIIFAGTALQTYSAAVGTQAVDFYNVTNANTVGLKLDSSIGIQNEINVAANAKLNLNKGDINMRSTAIRTAYITDLGTTAASTNITYNFGRFNIERYLFAKKAWRLLATPVEASSLSITDSWREGIAGAITITSTGYGTQITGPSASSIGMDEPTLRSSMKWYNKATNKYVEILNTADAIARHQGYYLFVRGDRAQNTSGAGGATNLRIRGKILTGDQTFTALKPTGPYDGFESVGNPYPSQINYKTVDKSNLEASLTVWDPTAGIYGVGRFIQYTSTTGLNGDYSNGSTILNTIESGQAFFIQSAANLSGSITIKESDKLSGSNLVSRIETQDRFGVYVPTLEINLHDTGSNATRPFLDHVLLNFDSNYSSEFDDKDVRKFMNANDNLAIKNGARNLIIERRNNLSIIDTLFLSLTNTKVATYRFEIDPSVLENLPLTAYLRDKFLQTETQVSLTDVTNINFNITTDAESKAADRFMIVFKTAIAPGQFTGNFISIAAEKNSDKTNTLKWSYSDELNIAQFSIERSNNGTVFTGVGNKNAGNLSNIGYYIFRDSLNVFGTNYYRVKATSTIGLVQYSAVVKVVENDPKPLFVVQPNPVVNKTLHINFEELQGDYNLRLIAKQGAIIFSKQINISSAKEIKNILLSDAVAAGIYELVLVDSTGMKLLQTISIK